MLVSKLSDVKSVEKLEFENVFTRILKREGWEINDLSPFSWQFLKLYDLWVVFKGLGVFETGFSFKKTQISQFGYHEMFVFSESCLSQKTFYCRKLIVFSCLQFADCYIWSRILSCGVIFRVFNHYYGILFSEKFSWENHGVVENMCSFSKSYL